MLSCQRPVTEVAMRIMHILATLNVCLQWKLYAWKTSYWPKEMVLLYVLVVVAAVLLSFLAFLVLLSR